MKPTLVFAYNADGGMFNALTDIAHKIFAPETYACNLCALTHTNFGMRREWKQFIEGLGRPVEFSHADELKEKYGVSGVELPAVFRKEDGKLREWVGAGEINSCRTLGELERLIVEKASHED